MRGKINHLFKFCFLLFVLFLFNRCDENKSHHKKEKEKTHIKNDVDTLINQSDNKLVGAWKIDSTELPSSLIEISRRFEGYLFKKSGKVYLFSKEGTLTKQILIGNYSYSGNLLEIKNSSGDIEKWEIENHSKSLIIKCIGGVPEFNNMKFFMSKIKWE